MRLMQDFESTSLSDMSSLLSKRIYNTKDILNAKQKIVQGIRAKQKMMLKPGLADQPIKKAQIEEQIAQATAALQRNETKFKIFA